MSDIVTRLRAVFHNDRSVELMNREAADEIERLRNELDGAKLAYRGACYDRDRIKAERDEARREVCKLKAWNVQERLGPEGYALLRKWDCFARDTSEHL